MVQPSARADRFALAVDLGTGGPKVGLVSFEGDLVWHDHVPVKTRHLDGGGAVQDAAEWWDIVVDATRRGLATGVVRPEQVMAVGVTGQWASTVPVDGAGRPVSDCVMWMDTRGRRHARRLFGGPALGYSPRVATTWIRRTGAVPSSEGDDSIGHMLHLERDQPDVSRAARWYLEPVDYLSMRFTGVAEASPASMSAAWLVDTREQSRSDPPVYDPVLVRHSRVPASKLPPLRTTGTVIGTVLGDVAAQLGIPAGAEVVTGIPDLHSAAVGSGAVRDYEAHLVISTTGWISCPVPEKKTDVINQLATVPGLRPDRYLLVDNQDTAGRGLQWLRDNVLTGAGSSPPSFEEVTTLAATAPPGSGNVVFTPWLVGERSPIGDRNARGGFHNLSLATTRAALARAVLEGVAYNARWLLGAVERFTGKRPLQPIRLIGGGAQSDLWCQIVADVLDRTIERVGEPLHANLRGAGLFAAMTLGEVSTEELRDLVAVDATFVPRPETRDVYDRLFGEFPKLYKHNKGLFARLNRQP